MQSSTAVTQPSLSRDETRALFGPTMGLVALTAGLSALRAYLAGLTAFDVQRLRRTRDLRAAPLIAASIFLDILNVFLLFLSLFGGRND